MSNPETYRRWGYAEQQGRVHEFQEIQCYEKICFISGPAQIYYTRFLLQFFP